MPLFVAKLNFINNYFLFNQIKQKNNHLSNVLFLQPKAITTRKFLSLQ